MSYNQVAIYKYGSQTQAVDIYDVATRPDCPTSRTPHYYRPVSRGASRMSGQYENEDERRQKLWEQDELDKERFLKFGSVHGVYRDPDHRRWAQEREYQQHCGQTPSTPQTSYQNAEKSADIQFKPARILNPTTGKAENVTVIEDSACKVNFIHPQVVNFCNLTPHRTSPIMHSTLQGSFECTEKVKISWIGQNSRNGTAWFYVAPESATSQLQILVGTEFSSENPNAFGTQALPGPALLNVQTQMKKSEAAQIQINQAEAATQAAELEERRKHAKHLKEQQKLKQKQKQNGSSSLRSSRPGNH